MHDAAWVNVHLATLRAGESAIADGVLAVADGKISWVGSRREWRGAARVEHDARGAWITPALIDCHTHLVYAGNRAHEFELRLKGASYEEIARAGGGILATVQSTRAASQEDLILPAKKRLRRWLEEGTGVIEIKSGYGLDLETELKMLRAARALGDAVTVKTTFLGAHAVPPEYRGHEDDYIGFVCDALLPAAAAAGLADAVDAFCERIAFTPAQTARVLEKANQLGLPLKLHADQLSDLGGAALAARHGALSADHLEHASDASIEAMRNAGTVAVLLPGAFYFLRETRLPPIESLRRLSAADPQHGLHLVPPHARGSARRHDAQRRTRTRHAGEPRYPRGREVRGFRALGHRRAGRACLRARG
jgi:imidazolonepropionase